MKIKFCGAAQEVTGSAHLITLDSGYTILLDCGLYQGKDSKMDEFNSSWKFEPKDVDCLVLSHAHIDHCGRIPKLVKDGFDGHIICTHATRSLCALMLMDSAYIQERDAAYHNKKSTKRIEPLYEAKDVTIAMQKFVSTGYNKWFNISPQIKLQFRDAGHIIGSASVTLHIQENGETKRIGFTGDVGRPNRPILRDPQPMEQMDLLISESTYGAKNHEGEPDQIDHLLKVIQETCIENRGKLLIPAFSLGRTQEIVYMLDRLSNQNKLPKIPIYVDSPLAVNATEIFQIHPECFDDDLNDYLRKDSNPWGFNDLHYIRNVELSKTLNHSKQPCVIISASGMMNAGRVKHHLYHNIDKPNSTLLVVGYCAPYTPGGQIRAGNTSLTLFGEEKQVRCNVEVMDSFSAHADQSELIEFITPHISKLKKLVLVHGEIEKQTELAKQLKNAGMDHVHIPALGDSISF